MGDELDVDDLLDAIAGGMDGDYDDGVDGWWAGGVRQDEDGASYGHIVFQPNGENEPKIYFRVIHVPGPVADA